ncbi:MAG TPA: hypothetical protein VH985_04465 [Candidatus Binatia bacterium]
MVSGLDSLIDNGAGPELQPSRSIPIAAQEITNKAALIESLSERSRLSQFIAGMCMRREKQIIVD